MFLTFVYLWLCWVFVAVRGLSLVGASFASLLRDSGFSLCWLLPFQSTGSRACGLQQSQNIGPVVVAHGLSCFTAHGIFLDEGSDLCLLRCKADP